MNEGMQIYFTQTQGFILVGFDKFYKEFTVKFATMGLVLWLETESDNKLYIHKVIFCWRIDTFTRTCRQFGNINAIQQTHTTNAHSFSLTNTHTHNVWKREGEEYKTDTHA